MEISLVAVLGFILSSLLIPAVVYIWRAKDREIKELKIMVAELRTKMETHELKSQDDIETIKVDLEKTKTNYVSRFGELGTKIDDKFGTVNQSISGLALEVREALILIKQKKEG